MASSEKLSSIRRVAFGTRLRANAWAYGLAAFVALALKYFYGNANAEQLYWLLAPLARLVELVAGIHFDWEPPAGFVGNAARVTIAAACSGITFLVVCFCTLSFSLVHRWKKNLAKLTWIILALLAAYALSLGANTVRIIAAIHLYQADIYGEWITPERVHRMIGIAVYLGFLHLFYLSAERITRQIALPLGSRLPQIRSYYPPFAWYILFTTMIPLLRAHGQPDLSLLAEHVLVVVTATFGAFAVCMGFAVIYARRVDLSASGREDDRHRPLAMRGIKMINKPEVAKQ